MKRLLIIGLCLLTLWPSTGLSYTSPGKPSGFINDFAQILSADVKTDLESKLAAFDKQTNHEIVVATIKSLDGDDIESYANTLFREWGAGKKSANNGVLFLIALDDRKMRIEVGYGLEGALTDIESKTILNEYVQPQFKNNDYNAGIIAGVTHIQKSIIGEVIPIAKQTNKQSKIGFSIDLALFAIFVIVPWLGSVLGRSRHWWLGGVLGGVIGSILWFISAFLLLIPLFIVVGLVFDYLVSKNFQQDKKSWWAGGGPHGWDRKSDGGSFGGFGGFGGGSSGGGGASSGW